MHTASNSKSPSLHPKVAAKSRAIFDCYLLECTEIHQRFSGMISLYIMQTASLQISTRFVQRNCFYLWSSANALKPSKQPRDTACKTETMHVKRLTKKSYNGDKILCIFSSQAELFLLFVCRYVYVWERFEMDHYHILPSSWHMVLKSQSL